MNAREKWVPAHVAELVAKGRELSERWRKRVGVGGMNSLEQFATDAEGLIDVLCELLESATKALHEPVPMRLRCPGCGTLHVDEGEFATKPHHTHACQKCGEVWRPAVVNTVGVQFLPGFKNP